MKPSNGKTVWKNEEKKWKPRNFQAVKVLWPAHGMNLPPEEVKEPVYAETHAQKMARESKERDERLKILNAENSAREAEIKSKSEAAERKRWNRKLNRFKSKQQRKIKQVAHKKAADVATGTFPLLRHIHEDKRDL